MSKSVRNALGVLLAVFMASMIAGALGVFGGSESATAGSSVPFVAPKKATSAPAPAPKAEAGEKPKVARGLTAEAVHEGSGRITISGEQKPADAGTRLTVQRKDSGDWIDFPAGSTVGSDGTYSLWLQTGRKGDLTFRMKDAKTGETSNPVHVKI
jgi:hypothetical protein